MLLGWNGQCFKKEQLAFMNSGQLRMAAEHSCKCEHCRVTFAQFSAAAAFEGLTRSCFTREDLFRMLLPQVEEAENHAENCPSCRTILDELFQEERGGLDGCCPFLVHAKGTPQTANKEQL